MKSLKRADWQENQARWGEVLPSPKGRDQQGSFSRLPFG
jgi:hypothetical protein